MSPKHLDGMTYHWMLIFGLLTFSYFLIMYLQPTELYGSMLFCDPSNLTECDEKTSSSSSLSSQTVAGDKTLSNNIEAPLVLPDISPTDQDLGSPSTYSDLGASDADSTNSNHNNDDSENSGDNDDTNRKNDQEEDEDSGNNEETSGGNDGRSLIPFP